MAVECCALIRLRGGRKQSVALDRASITRFVSVSRNAQQKVHARPEKKVGFHAS